MNFFKISRDIPFMRHAMLLNAISFATFIAAVVFIAMRGLAFSIEFTGDDRRLAHHPDHTQAGGRPVSGRAASAPPRRPAPS